MINSLSSQVHPVTNDEEILQSRRLKAKFESTIKISGYFKLNTSEIYAVIDLDEVYSGAALVFSTGTLKNPIPKIFREKYGKLTWKEDVKILQNRAGCRTFSSGIRISELRLEDKSGKLYFPTRGPENTTLFVSQAPAMSFTSINSSETITRYQSRPHHSTPETSEELPPLLTQQVSNIPHRESGNSRNSSIIHQVSENDLRELYLNNVDLSRRITEQNRQVESLLRLFQNASLPVPDTRAPPPSYSIATSAPPSTSEHTRGRISSSSTETTSSRAPLQVLQPSSATTSISPVFSDRRGVLQQLPRSQSQSTLTTAFPFSSPLSTQNQTSLSSSTRLTTSIRTPISSPGVAVNSLAARPQSSLISASGNMLGPVFLRPRRPVTPDPFTSPVTTSTLVQANLLRSPGPPPVNPIPKDTYKREQKVVARPASDYVKMPATILHVQNEEDRQTILVAFSGSCIVNNIGIRQITESEDVEAWGLAENVEEQTTSAGALPTPSPLTATTSSSSTSPSSSTASASSLASPSAVSLPAPAPTTPEDTRPSLQDIQEAFPSPPRSEASKTPSTVPALGQSQLETTPEKDPPQGASSLAGQDKMRLRGSRKDWEMKLINDARNVLKGKPNLQLLLYSIISLKSLETYKTNATMATRTRSQSLTTLSSLIDDLEMKSVAQIKRLKKTSAEVDRLRKGLYLHLKQTSEPIDEFKFITDIS